MPSTTIRTANTAAQLPAYLKDNLSALQEFSKNLDKVSQEIRAVEASLCSAGGRLESMSRLEQEVKPAVVRV